MEATGEASFDCFNCLGRTVMGKVDEASHTTARGYCLQSLLDTTDSQSFCAWQYLHENAVISCRAGFVFRTCRPGWTFPCILL
jgi:hypothetical protein